MTENLSNSKRKYIENWRQSVCSFMENGNICRITIAEMTPEPGHEGIAKKASVEHSRAIADLSPRMDMASPTLPAVKFSYCHANDDVPKRQSTRSRASEIKSRSSDLRYKEKQMYTRTMLPPSPNGCVVQNGLDVHVPKRRSTTLKAVDNNVINNVVVNEEVPEVIEGTRNSSKLAREIYEKYNMKSKTHSMLGRKNSMNGAEQYSMPWRNKTFLSLPLRFNGSLQKQNNKIKRERSFMTEVKYDMNGPEEDIKYIKEWEDVIYL